MGPRESRFADVAIRKGYISFEKLIEVAGSNGKGEDLGKTLLERGLITQGQHDEILKAAGAQDEAMPSDPTDAKFCEALVRRGLVGFGQLTEVMRLREKHKKGERYLKTVDDLLIDMGLLTARQIRQMRQSYSLPRIDLPERTHSKLGELALKRGYITEEQLADCLQFQRGQSGKGVSIRLGEILLSKGYISPEQLDELLTLHADETKALKIPGYEILAKIGEGGMGEIFKARQISVDRLVAIKVLNRRYAQDTEYMERFIREARLLARLDHPYIVKAIDAGQSKDTFYYVMEFVDGVTVLKLLRQKGRLPERDCLKIGLYVAHALEHAAKHKLVHRDVKPTNIMITRDGVVKLCDLGIAKLLDSSSTDGDQTRMGYAVGSPYYIAPESCLGTEVDIRSDLYSLGATLYHCATGKPAFDGPTAASVLAQHVHREPDPPKKLNGDLSQEFSDAVLKLMQKLPEARFKSPGSLAARLEGIMRGERKRFRPSESDIKTARRVRDPDVEPTVIYKTRVSWGAVAAAVLTTVGICAAIAAYLLNRAGALDLPF